MILTKISSNINLLNNKALLIGSYLLFFHLKKLDNYPRKWFFHLQRQTKPNPSFGPFPNGLFFSQIRIVYGKMPDNILTPAHREL